MFAFVSDVHLDKPHEKHYGAFLRFIANCEKDESLEVVFLMGDIFDVWVGPKNVFTEKYRDVVLAIEGLAKKKKVVFIEGNHDFNFHNFWSERGVKTYTDSCSFDLDGKKWLLAHGDLLDPDDKDYLRLRKFLRSGFAGFLIKVLPGSIVNWIGTKMSTTHDKSYHSSEVAKKSFKPKWERLTTELAKKEDFDVFICGHFHHREILESQKKIAINLGTWLESPIKVLMYKNQEFKFVELV